MAGVEKIGVTVCESSARAQRIASAVNARQSRYQLVCVENPWLCRDVTLPTTFLHLVSERRTLFNVCRDGGIRISTHDSGPISRYLRVTEEEYMVMGVFLGLAQWRVLDGNHLIRPEDWIHDPDGSCLYSPCDSVQDYALLMENAYLCGSCRDFYCCLGAETELCLIQELAERFSRTAPA